MKKIISVILVVSMLAMAGCATRESGGKRENTQDLRKSPCASLIVESQDAIV